MVRQGCFGIGRPMFPPFYGFLSQDPDRYVMCPGKIPTRPGNRRSAPIRDFANITRGPV
jgi:hypothetical protein